MSRRILVAFTLLVGLSGCLGAPPAAPVADHALPAVAAAAPPPADDGTVVEAVRVLPAVYPIDVVGHIRPAPCVGAASCDFGATVQRPGQHGTLAAGVEWTRLTQEFTDAEGLFWRIRLVGSWTSSTPAVEGVELSVGTLDSGCGTCEPRLAFRHRSTDGLIDVERTDVFLEDGEDTLAYWVEPTAVGPAAMQPADDVRVELRGWTAAYRAAGDPIRLA